MPADPAQAEREFQEALRLLRLVEPAAIVDAISARHRRAVLEARIGQHLADCDLVKGCRRDGCDIYMDLRRELAAMEGK